MGILSIFMFIGTVVPQEGFTEPEDFGRWQRDNPLLFKAADAVGITRVFTAWWFIAALIVFFLNTLAFSVEKIRTIGRKKTIPPEGLPILFEAKLSAPPERRAVEEALRKKRFRIMGCPAESVYAEKGRLYTGSLILHLSILLVFFSGTLTALTRFSGVMEVTEGQTVQDSPEGYAWFSEAPLGKKSFEGFKLKLLEFIPSYYPDGKLKSYESRLLVGYDNTSREEVVRASSLFKVMGTEVYQRDTDGISCLLVTKDGDRLVDRTYVLFDKQREGFTLRTKYRMPETGWDIEGELFPDAFLGPEGFGSRSFILSDPVLDLTVSEKGKALFGGKFFPGDKVSIRGLTLGWEDARYWSSYWVTRDSGAFLIQIAFASGIAGLFLLVVTDEKKVFVSFMQDEGFVRFEIRGRSARYQNIFSGELAALGRMLTEGAG